MKRFLKKTGKVLAWIVGVVIVLLLVLLAEPKWVLNQKTLVWALHKYGAGYHPKWKSLDFEVRNVNLLTKRIVFKSEDFCVHEKGGGMDACFPLLDLDTTIHVGLSPVVSVRRMERLVVHSDTIKVDETREPQQAAAQKKKAQSGGNITLIPRPIRNMTVGLLDVKIPSAVVKTSTGTTQARLAAHFTEEGSAPLTADAYVVTSGSAPTSQQHYRADLTAATDLWRLGHVHFLDLTARLRGDGGLRADVAVDLKPPKKGVLKLAARASAATATMTLSADASGEYSQDGAKGRATLAVSQPGGAIRRFALQDCRLDEPAKKGRPERADLTCGIDVVPAPFGKPAGKAPKRLVGTLAAHADFKKHQKFDATVSAYIEPQKKFHDFYARFQMALAGRADKLPQSLKARHKLELGMKIERFQDLVAYVQDTEFAIPAPVNAFSGPVTLTVKTAGDSRGPNQKVVYDVITDLASAKQALKLAVTGHVDVIGLFSKDRRIVDRTDVDLKDVMLQLPDIKIGKMPSPMVDTRINTGAPSRSAEAAEHRPKNPAASTATATNVDFDAHVFTSQPLRLVTNLVPKQPVPISLDIHARTNGLAGRINIDPFDVEVFHQMGHIDHITLTPTPGSSDMKLDGKIVYKRQDVTVNILLVGSTDKPTITFESDPPMTQQQIVALLLFGKSPAELDSDQTASAGTASEAFASGALGLTSLYLFASTPIDSVGYDPATQTYQIRFKLPGGATLAVGSNLEESKTLTLRKRVARNVELETQLRSTNQQSQRRDAVTTFLEWFRRY